MSLVLDPAELLEAYEKSNKEGLDFLNDFVNSEKNSLALVEGSAGTGKTTLIATFLRRYRSAVLAAPTHKAVRVLRDKLEALNVKTNSDIRNGHGGIFLGTTAAVLGIAPIIEEEQGEELRFGFVGSRVMDEVDASLLVIDEASMLGWPELSRAWKKLHSEGKKILLLGDRAQLPPVKTQSIPFDSIKCRLELTIPRRQSKGGEILQLAAQLRSGGKSTFNSGGEIVHVKDLVKEYCLIDASPESRAEEDRAVIIAYRNRVVDYAQDTVCKHLYGHGADTIREGEIVVADGPFRDGYRSLCNKQDELVVEKVVNRDRGYDVTYKNVKSGLLFGSEFYEKSDMEDVNLPYNVELKRLFTAAKNLEDIKKKCTDRDKARDIDTQRRFAWKEYFNWRDNVVLRVRHPFAITSHKSQGSTYSTVYADIADLKRWGLKALYVACTRPKDRLVVNSLNFMNV